MYLNIKILSLYSESKPSMHTQEIMYFESHFQSWHLQNSEVNVGSVMQIGVEVPAS